MVAYKQRCIRCKQNMVLMKGRRQLPICMQCNMRVVDRPIEDHEMKEFFAIERTLYEKHAFLRRVKEVYHEQGMITEPQKEAFLRVLEEAKLPEEEQEKLRKERQSAYYARFRKPVRDQ
ncbi:MAG: hypothetical protein ABIH41_05095 [Nanoarchaeota archaeon]